MCGMPRINWCVCVRTVGKMGKGIGMTIRKSIVVSFLPCLVVVWHSIPICSFIFENDFCYLFLLFFWEGGGGENHGSLWLHSSL